MAIDGSIPDKKLLKKTLLKKESLLMYVPRREFIQRFIEEVFFF